MKIDKCSITENELEILEVLWTENRPLSRPELLNRLSLPESNQQTIHRFLNNMLEKGVIKVVGSVRCGKRPGRTYAPTISREDYVISQVDKLMPAASFKKPRLAVACALFNSSNVDEEFIAELENMIQKKREELHNE